MSRGWGLPRRLPFCWSRQAPVRPGDGSGELRWSKSLGIQAPGLSPCPPHGYSQRSVETGKPKMRGCPEYGPAPPWPQVWLPTATTEWGSALRAHGVNLGLCASWSRTVVLRREDHVLWQEALALHKVLKLLQGLGDRTPAPCSAVPSTSQRALVSRRWVGRWSSM